MIAAGGSYTCAITRTISGDYPGSHVNTVTATAEDDDGNTDTAQATETVDFTDVLPDIAVTKTADVASVPETGGDVTYTFVVTNNGAESVTLTSLVDDIFGDISVECGLPQVIAAGGSYTCAITRTISGDFPGSHVNTVTATAEDDDGNTDTAQATETVDFSDVLPDIA